MKVLEREEVYHKLLEELSKEEHEQGMHSSSGPALIYGEEGPGARGSVPQRSLRAADLLPPLSESLSGWDTCHTVGSGYKGP